MGKLVHQESTGLTHFAHEGVEALPVFIAVEQQLPSVALQATTLSHARGAPQGCRTASYSFIHLNMLLVI